MCASVQIYILEASVQTYTHFPDDNKQNTLLPFNFGTKYITQTQTHCTRIMFTLAQAQKITEIEDEQKKLNCSRIKCDKHLIPKNII